MEEACGRPMLHTEYNGISQVKLPSVYVYARLIRPSSLFALLTACSTYLLKIKLGFTCTPRSRSSTVTSIGMSV